MEDLDFLESMAQAAIQMDSLGIDDAKAADDMIRRWQTVFGYSRAEAAQQIEEKRRDLGGRVTLSAEAWEAISADKEAQGYDKETYEHACWLAKTAGSSSRQASTTRTAVQKSHVAPPRPAYFLLKLDGPLSDVASLKAAIGHGAVTKTFAGQDDSGSPATFCRVDSLGRDKVLAYIDALGVSFSPVFVRDSKAEKSLSSFSIYPTLGIDSTLPQHRIGSSWLNGFRLPLPKQDQYPVWYFFYGTLAQPEVLKRLLRLDHEPAYRKARLFGGVLKTWGGKYKALVDGADDAVRLSTSAPAGVVKGSAFLVQDEEQEDALCYYETDCYEVVRCDVHMDGDEENEKDNGGGEVVKGLTFRFVGELDC
ncbi:hypothetical protein QBC42DRAFT_315466 [Cladorrhinum samala]|uniref:Putative gamma-glutamylcyclotransferase n=1 Tax=Cladorrhinum samala TaxID=585594 RepID=A0AAV9HWV1_9PEZI|nr:hypothetical protein QBC42DRAFT_315466 [Cladorrhinum samala]